jgi:CheY-like chemotaxis protein
MRSPNRKSMTVKSRSNTEPAEDLRRVAMVLVGEEEAFVDLFQHFPPKKYPLVFAQDVPQALELVAAQPPQILILPLDLSRDAMALLELLRCARARQTRTIALTDESPGPDVAALIDRTVARSAPAELLVAAGELLGERRSMPRVAMEVEVTITGLGTVMATVISGRSLFVPRGASRLKSGQMVQISLQSSQGELGCWATVIRVVRDEQGPSGFALALPEREREVRSYLDGLVRGMLLLERAELGADDPAAGLPEGLTKRLAERLAQDVSAMRARVETQATLTETLNARLDALADADAKAVKWSDVQPVLAQKWSAQRNLFKRLLEKVEGISADQKATQKLEATLREGGELRQQLEQQAACIDALRARLDQQLDAESRGDLLDEVRQTQLKLESALQSQARAIDDLSLRVELLSARGTTEPSAKQMKRVLEEHSVQIASLALRLDGLRDQIRVGKVDERFVEQLEDDLARQQNGLRRLQEPVSTIERQGVAPEPSTEFEDEVPTQQHPAEYPSQILGSDSLDAAGRLDQSSVTDENLVPDKELTTKQVRPVAPASAWPTGRVPTYRDAVGPDTAADDDPTEVSPDPIADARSPGSMSADEQPKLVFSETGVSAELDPLNEPTETDPEQQPYGDTNTRRHGAAPAPAITEAAPLGQPSPFARAEAASGDLFADVAAPARRRSGTRYPWWLYLTVAVAGVAIGFGVFMVVSLGRSTGAPDSLSSEAQGRQREVDLNEHLVVTPAAERLDAASTGEVTATPESGQDPASGTMGEAPAAARDTGGAVQEAASGGSAPDAARSRADGAERRDAASPEPDAASPEPDAASPEPDVEASEASAEAQPPTPAEQYRRLIRRAIQLIRANRLKASRRVLTQALGISDTHLVRWLLARSHWKQKQQWPAIHHMKKSLAKAPPRLKAKRHAALGLLYIEVGKKSLGCKQFAAALEINPRHRRAGERQGQYCR